MGEYEDRYPDAYGHGEVIDSKDHERHIVRTELPRPTREPAHPHHEHAAAPRDVVPRAPQEIADDIARQLNENRYIDATDVSVTIEGSEVTLDGVTNSQMAISLAKALCSNTAGVSRVHTNLRVRPGPDVQESVEPVVYKVE